MQRRFLFWDNPKDAVITITVFLMLIGCINVFSASFVEAKDMFDNGYFYLVRYAVAGVLGLGLLWFLGWGPDYHFWLKYRHLWYIGLLVLLILVDAFGVTNKGAQRWLHIGGQSIQPSEFVKLSIIILGSGSLGIFLRERQRVSLFDVQTLMPFLQALLFSALVYIQPDMGTAAIILALMIGLYVIAGLRWLEMATLFGAALFAAVVLVIVAPYRFERVKIWFDPWQDAGNNGYQVVQSLMSIGSGGLTGTPVGMGTGKFFYLPEAHTDFAFAIFCQEWGFLGAGLLILLFFVLAVAIQRIASNTTNEEGFLLVSGINFLVVGQAAANMAMVCGLLPVIGVPLSFISYGGTALLANLAGIGLVVAVYNAEVRDAKAKHQVAADFAKRKENLGVKRTEGGRWRFER